MSKFRCKRNSGFYLSLIVGVLFVGALGMVSDAAYQEEQVGVRERQAEQVQRLAARQQARDEAAATYLLTELADKPAVLKHVKRSVASQEIDLRELYQARVGE